MTTLRAPVLAALLLWTLPAAADTLFVDDGSPCPGAGTTGNPYCSIVVAVGAASATGDTIQVRPGIYQECINARIPPKAVAILAEDSNPALTVIDGSACFTVSAVVLADGGSVSGFTITNGNEGAITSFGSVVITNNVIEGNSAQLSGGGIFADSGVEDYAGPRTIEIQIVDNTIRGNQSLRDGGGIWVEARSEPGIDALALVEGNLIKDNQSSGVGAGVAGLTNAAFGAVSSVRITQNVIQGNDVAAASSIDGFGGGIWVSTAGDGYETITVDGNTVGAPAGSNDTSLGNTAVNNGGGISASIQAADSADHAVFVEGNTVRRNTAAVNGGGIELFADGVTLDQPGNPTPGRFSILIADNAVGANGAAEFGGGILVDVGTLLTTSRRNPVDVVGNILTSNSAGEGGGGGEIRAFAVDDAFNAVHVRHNTITGNFATNVDDLGFGGGLSLFVQTEGAAIGRIDARFNTLTANGADLGGGGIDVAAVNVPVSGSSGASFIEIANSRIENNTGFAVGGPEFESPGSFNLVVRSSDLSPNTAGTLEDTLDPVATLVCMPATTGAQLAFPGVDSDGDVDGVDLLRLATAFASVPGTVHYNPIADLDGDLGVDGNDLAVLGASFGDTCP